jgi:hypothetical protein
VVCSLSAIVLCKFLLDTVATLKYFVYAFRSIDALSLKKRTLSTRFGTFLRNGDRYSWVLLRRKTLLT